MNIAVLVKLVPDSQAVVKIGEDRRYISTADLNFVLNPYDEYAVEEALKIKEKEGGEVTVFSFGDDSAQKALRTALAMGAGSAVHVKSEGGSDMLGTAKSLASVLKDRGFDFVIAGKVAIDDDCGAIGPMVAELMDIPHVTAVHSLEIADGKLTAKRDIEGGVEVFESSLPVLITAEKGLNDPRYATLKGIMMSKKKKIEVVEAESFGSKTEVIKMTYPPSRPPGRVIGEGAEAVPELVKLLKEEAKVL